VVSIQDPIDFLERPITGSGREPFVAEFEACVTISECWGILITRLIDAAERFRKDERGFSLVECAMLLALVAIVALAGIAAVGPVLSSFFNAAATSI